METSIYHAEETSGGDVAVDQLAAEEFASHRFVDRLRSYFAGHADAHCLLVVDPSQRVLNDRPDAGVFFSQQSSVTIPIEHGAFPPPHRPYLIELDLSTAQGAALLSESVCLAFEDRRPENIACGNGQRIGGWVASAVPAQEVAVYWGQRVVQVDEQGRRCALRFYDMRALSLIWPILEASQQKYLLGPVSEWHALDACTQGCAYAAHTAPSSRLALTRDQWLTIHRHGMVNRALGLHMHAVKRQPHPQEVETAVASAARAERYGLHDPDDRVAFVGHALEWHPYFDAYPAVRRALQQVSAEHLYTAAISELAPAEIDEIRRGSWFQKDPVD